MIKESEVLERIATSIDDADADDLAKMHNRITKYPSIIGADIIPEEGWHLVPHEGTH